MADGKEDLDRTPDMSRSISICTSAIGKSATDASGLERGLSLLREAGFTQIECSRQHIQHPRFAETLAKNGLRVWAVHGELGADAISDQERTRRAAVAAEAARMEFAAPYAPCPYVIHYLSRHNDPQVNVRWRHSVEELLPKAESLGLTLAIETVPYKPEVNERYACSREVAEFVRSFRSDFMKICMDVNHSNLHEDILQAIANCHSIIATVHISDNHGVREEHLIPGEGIIDFPAVWRALSDARYGGPLNLECAFKTPPTLQELALLRKWAAELIRGCM